MDFEDIASSIDARNFLEVFKCDRLSQGACFVEVKAFCTEMESRIARERDCFRNIACNSRLQKFRKGIDITVVLHKCPEEFIMSPDIANHFLNSFFNRTVVNQFLLERDIGFVSEFLRDLLAE